MAGEKNSGMAIASMVLGICSIILFWVPFLGVIVGIVGVILGFVSLSEIKKKNLNGKGMAIAGIVLGFVGVALFIVALMIWGALIGMMSTSVNGLNITQNITSNLSKVGRY